MTTATAAPDLKAVLEAIGWASSRFSIATSAPRGSREREDAIGDLRRAAGDARDLLDRYPGKVSDVARVALRAAELGLARLQRPR